MKVVPQRQQPGDDLRWALGAGGLDGRAVGAGQHRPRPGSAENAVAERELPCRLEPGPHLNNHPSFQL